MKDKTVISIVKMALMTLLILVIIYYMFNSVLAVDYSIGVYKAANSTTLNLNYNGSVSTYDVNESTNLTGTYILSCPDASGLTKDQLIQELGVLNSDLSSWWQETYTNYTGYKSGFEGVNQSLYFCYSDLEVSNEKNRLMNITLTETTDTSDRNWTLFMAMAIIGGIGWLLSAILFLKSSGKLDKFSSEIQAKREGK